MLRFVAVWDYYLYRIIYYAIPLRSVLAYSTNKNAPTRHQHGRMRIYGYENSHTHTHMVTLANAPCISRITCTHTQTCQRAYKNTANFVGGISGGATQWRCRQQRKQLFFNVGLLDPGSWAYGTHTHAHTHAHARTSNIMNTSQASGGEVVRRGNPFRTNW